MGFLKRLFSTIGKKDKKKRPQIIHNTDSATRAIEEAEHEATMGRLLRSSSTRFAVVSEVDYASLPPMPHPINEVTQTPTGSTASVATTSLNRRGTYNVTVHRKTQLATTEFPNANRGLDNDSETPPGHSADRENSQLLRLRSDPSVASLLDIYDEHGRLPSKAFSDSPPSPEKQEGRAQTRRSGSTLRALLGHPGSLKTKNESEQSPFEGDISWAERFLSGNNSASTSTSSLGLPTPSTTDAHFPHVLHDTTFSTDHDHSNSAMSMQVEVSIGSNRADEELPHDLNQTTYNPYRDLDPKTPQRASQVFDFLTERRRPRISGASDNTDRNEENEENYSEHTHDSRLILEPRSMFSSPSAEGGEHLEASQSHFSEDSSFDYRPTSEEIRDAPFFSDIHHDRNQNQAQPTQDTTANRGFTEKSVFEEREDEEEAEECDDDEFDAIEETPRYARIPSIISDARRVKVIMTAPTKVIVTAPTPSAAGAYTTSAAGTSDGTNGLPSGRIPVRVSRGPRPPPAHHHQRQQRHRQRTSSSSSYKPRRSSLSGSNDENSNVNTPGKDVYTRIPVRKGSTTPHHHQGRRASGASTRASDAGSMKGSVKSMEREMKRGGKENVNANANANAKATDNAYAYADTMSIAYALGLGPVQGHNERGSQRGAKKSMPTAAAVATGGGSGGLGVKAELPMTPLRYANTNQGSSDVKGSLREKERGLFRTAVSPGMFRPPAGMTPSPASSSELSPMGREMMTNLRTQRMKAREGEKMRKSWFAATKVLSGEESGSE